MTHQTMSQTKGSIKAIFFDFDGVLTTDQSGSQTTIRSLSNTTGLTEVAIRGALTPHIGDLVLGLKTHEEVWPEICIALGTEIDPAALVEAFGSTPLNRPMLHIAEALGKRYQVGMITDNPSDRIRCLTELHRLNLLFDPIVVSADIGSSKYTTEIFQFALKQINVEAHETLFIDNTKKNLDVARRIGMNVIFHDDATNDVVQLRSTLENTYGLAVQISY